jgi:hypothetical protein
MYGLKKAHQVKQHSDPKDHALKQKKRQKKEVSIDKLIKNDSATPMSTSRRPRRTAW